jgi:hypothetical protein
VKKVCQLIRSTKALAFIMIFMLIYLITFFVFYWKLEDTGYNLEWNCKFKTQNFNTSAFLSIWSLYKQLLKNDRFYTN